MGILGGISCKVDFFKSQNPLKAGNLCKLAALLIYLSIKVNKQG